MSSNIAIYYHPEGFDTSSPKLMGRHAAGEGFLRAWSQHCGADQIHYVTDSVNAAELFQQVVQGYGWSGRVSWLPSDRPEMLESVGALLLPGPSLDKSAWQRRIVGQRRYSLLGITHTTASAHAMDTIADLLTAPVQPWDALICTSQAVRSMVIDLWSEQADYLRHRFGLPQNHKWVLPQLPVIPLGVDSAAFRANPAARVEWRRKLGIDDRDVVVLFVGRLSFHAKAHPVPMYLALEEAIRGADSTGSATLPDGGRVHLIEAGWFANEFIENAFAEMAAECCPSVIRHVLDGRDKDVRTSIWHAADIFCSLSDNIQETFGLTPIEAMAAGLPCVVSDWNGYKETVRHEQDGFRIDTWMPSAPLGEDLARRHAFGHDNYDNYCGQACQFVAVDIKQAATAFRSLLTDGQRRRDMGMNAALRAQATFDWHLVVNQYKQLAADLAQIRARDADVESVPLRQGRPFMPARMDPFKSFQHYPSHRLTGQTRVTLTSVYRHGTVDHLRQGPTVRYADRALPLTQDCEAMLSQLADSGGMAVLDLINDIPVERRGLAVRGLVWLAKYGLVQLNDDVGGKGS